MLQGGGWGTGMGFGVAELGSSFEFFILKNKAKQKLLSLFPKFSKTEGEGRV